MDALGCVTFGKPVGWDDPSGTSMAHPPGEPSSRRSLDTTGGQGANAPVAPTMARWFGSPDVDAEILRSHGWVIQRDAERRSE